MVQETLTVNVRLSVSVLRWIQFPESREPGAQFTVKEKRTELWGTSVRQLSFRMFQ